MASSLAVLCVFLAFEAAAQTGAAREAFKGSAEFRDSVGDTATSVEKYANQLEKTDRSLARLRTANGDLRERYQSFSKDLRKLEKAQKNAVSHVDKMRARETEYFTAWEKANMQIADPELRDSLSSRRSHVITQYQALAENLSAIGRKLQPLTSHLRDLDLFLGADASHTNFKEAEAMIELSREEIRSLKHEIGGVQSMLRAFLSETLARS